MKFYIPGVLFALTFLSACSQSSVSNVDEKISYGLGAIAADNIPAEFFDLSSGAFCRGLDDGLAGEEMIVSQDDFFKLFTEKKTQWNSEISEKNLAEASAFIETLKTKENVFQITDSNVWYEIVSEGEGTPIKNTDTLNIKLGISGLNGPSMSEEKKSANVPLPEAMPSWKVALSQVKEGGRVIIYIPDEDLLKIRSSIQPGKLGVFDIEVLEIIS